MSNYSIKVGDIFNHPTYGAVSVVEDLGRDNGYPYFKIKFHNTGTTTPVRGDHLYDYKYGDKKYNIYLRSIYPTNGFGPVRIVKFLGPNEFGEPMVDIVFINSGNLYAVKLQDVLECNVTDIISYSRYYTNMRGSSAYSGNVDLNRLYASNSSGPFKILYIDDTGKNCMIEFVNTGYIKKCKLNAALICNVKDDMSQKTIPIDKSLIGNYDGWFRRRIYGTWSGMIDRCKKETASLYKHYGGIGVNIDPAWMDFETFASQLPGVARYDRFCENPLNYQLDKDYLQLDKPKGERVYSQSTCIFLNTFDNNNLRAIEKRMADPDSYSTRYYGVELVKKCVSARYDVRFTVNNTLIRPGVFSNIIAAASCYNYWYRYFHAYEIIPLLNDLEYEMPPSEFIKYNTTAKQLYHLV